MNKYEISILRNFNLSIIMPFYKKIEAFRRILPLNAKYLERIGIEVILVLDEPSQEDQVIQLIESYSLIRWVVLVNRKEHPWRNPAKAINVGIKFASKKYIMVCSPESLFKTDAILKLRVIVEIYKNAFAIGKVCFNTFKNMALDDNMLFVKYGSILVEKCNLINVGCYGEAYEKWGGEDDQIRAKLEYFGYRKLYVNDAVLIHFDESDKEIISRVSKPRNISKETYKYSQRPSLKDITQKDWGNDFNDKIFDYRGN